MTRRTELIAAFIVLLVFWAIAVTFAVRASAAPDKPPDVPWCVGSDPGYCDPSDEPAIRPIPPDMPPAAKLRAQLAKERKQHREAMRACKEGK